MIWPILGCAVLVSGAVFAHALIVAYRTPAEREPDAVERTARTGLLTFDQHAAVATALLQPDVPLFTATDEALLAFADEWLAYVDALPTTQES